MVVAKFHTLKLCQWVIIKYTKVSGLLLGIGQCSSVRTGMIKRTQIRIFPHSSYIIKMTGRCGKGGKELSPSTLALSKRLFLKVLTWTNICSFLRTTCYFNKTKWSLTIYNQWWKHQKKSRNNWINRNYLHLFLNYYYYAYSWNFPD